MASIVPDEEVFSQFTEKSKKQYRRICDVEVDGENELPVEMVQEEEEDLSGLVLEDDPDMYAAAGITYQPSSTSANIQQAIQSAITSSPSLQEANVSVKVVVMQDNHGSVNL